MEEFPIELNGFLTTIDLNILPLGSYDVIIGMDWLEKKKSKVDCYDKVVECFDDEGRLNEVREIS